MTALPGARGPAGKGTKPPPAPGKISGIPAVSRLTRRGRPGNIASSHLESGMNPLFFSIVKTEQVSSHNEIITYGADGYTGPDLMASVIREAGSPTSVDFFFWRVLDPATGHGA